MYLAWSMTYFHINLDPRGKKKSFAANSYTRDYIGFPFVSLTPLSSFLSFFFRVGFSKKRLQGGAWEMTLQLVALGCYHWASGSGFVGQLNHLLGVGFRLLLPVQWFLGVQCWPQCYSRPRLWSVWVCVPGNTRPLTLCLPACLPLSTSAVMSPTCVAGTYLSLFITVLGFVLFFSPLLSFV